MILTIDTDNKNIRIEKICNLGELMRFLQETFPDGEWRKYDVCVNNPYPYIQPIVTPPFSNSGSWGSSAPTLTNY